VSGLLSRKRKCTHQYTVSQSEAQEVDHNSRLREVIVINDTTWEWHSSMTVRTHVITWHWTDATITPPCLPTNDDRQFRCNGEHTYFLATYPYGNLEIESTRHGLMFAFAPRFETQLEIYATHGQRECDWDDNNAHQCHIHTQTNFANTAMFRAVVCPYHHLNVNPDTKPSKTPLSDLILYRHKPPITGPILCHTNFSLSLHY